MRFFVEVGDMAEFSKTVTETDIAMFSAITGDFDPIHVDEEYARHSRFGHRIAHAGLTMGLLSTCASAISRRAVRRGSRGVSVSLGYDRIRFTAPVFIGDTLTARYVVERLDHEKARSHARLEVVNQHGETCLRGEHMMKWLPFAAEVEV